jgi:hypothetical protein
VLQTAVAVLRPMLQTEAFLTSTFKRSCGIELLAARDILHNAGYTEPYSTAAEEDGMHSIWYAK